MFSRNRFAAIGIAAVLTAAACAAQSGKIDTSKTVVLLPFESSVKGAPGLTDAVRGAIALFLKDDGMFPAVLTSEDAKDKEKSATVQIGATLTDFVAGNQATRALVGMGSGRPHAGFDFVVKDGASGQTVWQTHIKETASFWTNASVSSISLRSELPEKIAKTFLKQLKKSKSK